MDLVRGIEAEVAPIDFRNIQRTNNRQTSEGDNKLRSENESYEMGDKPSEEGIWFEIPGRTLKEELEQKRRHAKAIKSLKKK
jgi:hypothetical protein